MIQWNKLQQQINNIVYFNIWYIKNLVFRILKLFVSCKDT